MVEKYDPLVIEEKAEGLIGLANKPEDFNDDDARIVMALANLVAIGLRKAKIEAELRDSRRELSELVSELELYESLLRHDLTNDLQLVLGETELAKGLSESKTVIEYLNSIESAAKRMTRLLTVVRGPESNLNENLYTFLQELVADMTKSYTRMKIKTHIDGDSGKVKFKGKSLIPFVFDNIIRNSVQHVNPEVSVNIYTKIGSEQVILDFVDDGPGIKKEKRNTLFRKVDDKSKHGIGLYLCRKIVESYEGRIYLLDEKEYGSGTAIRVELPRIHEEVREKVH